MPKDFSENIRPSMRKIVTIFLAIMFVYWLYQFSFYDKDARNRLNLLMDEWTVLESPNQANTTGNRRVIEKREIVHISQDYISTLHEFEIDNFYSETLVSNSWKKFKDYQQPSGLSRRKVHYCKNGMEFILDFAETGPRSYTVILKWDALPSLRPSC